MRIRFHLDEHISGAIAAGLRRRHINVTTTADSGLISADDVDQLAFATASGSVLVTHDADFLRLQANGATHAGIAYCAQGSLTIRQMLRGLILIYDVLSAEEIANRIEFL